MTKTMVKKEGFESILFPGNNTKEKVMIVVSGSNGGMTMTEKCARFYHKNGMPALALALFKTSQTSPDLNEVPLEYAERAIHWLKEQGYQKIGIDGMSKGSEFALLAASMFTELSCVIARVPSYFVSEGLAGNGAGKHPCGSSCWSVQGKPVHYARYKTSYFNLIESIIKNKELFLLDYNRDKEVDEESIIPIEKIKAPVLFLSSKNDSVWPSYESSELMMKRLKEKNFVYPYKHVCYKFISHAMTTDLSPLVQLAFKTERINKESCRKERGELKKELLNWVNVTWN